MRIDEIPEFRDKKHTLTIEENKTVIEAAAEMKKHGYGAIVVVNKSGKLTGIFTERDVLYKIAAENISFKDLKVKDVMTKNVKTARASDTVSDSMRRMTQGKFRHLPVVDDDGNVAGMLSLGDFVAATWPQLLHQLKNQARTSFFDNTQLWMMVLAVLAYFTLLKIFFP